MPPTNDSERQERIQAAIEDLLLVTRDREKLREYVERELPKIAPDRRMHDRYNSLFVDGVSSIHAVLISKYRLLAKVRWGDFLLAVYEHVTPVENRRLPISIT